MIQFVGTRLAAKEQVRRFANLAPGSIGLQAIIPQTHHWYATRSDNGWLFGPSKFVGYVIESAEDYLAHAGGSGLRHGGETQNYLKGKRWAVQAEGALRAEVEHALDLFVSALGRKRRGGEGDTIWVFSDDLEHTSARAEDWRERIIINSAICHGRPSIAGTRIRVSDILDMLAHGADRETILADYPSLSSKDIDAALSYAAESMGHRVILAA
jgi:uncharacterized protein (DUF433 family)